MYIVDLKLLPPSQPQKGARFDFKTPKTKLVKYYKLKIVNRDKKQLI